MLKRAILYLRKFNVDTLERNRFCLPSYTNSEHCSPATDLSSTDVVADASVLDGLSLEELYPESSSGGDSLSGKMSKINKEWIFAMANFLIELIASVFDQLSTVHKPRYAMIAMLMSFIAAVICIVELAYKAGKERVIWRWPRSKLPWLYYSSPTPSEKRFGTFPEIIGLICVILQSILSAIAYTFYLRHADYPIKISFWPLLFALGLLCSKSIQNPDQNAAFRRD